MPTLSTILNCIPASSSSCSRFTQHQPPCAHKLSPVSRIRAAQIIRTGDALFAVEAPLRQCLAQLAPLMLCESEHRGKLGEGQLLVLWWLKIMACRDSEIYLRETVDVFRELGCLEILDGGWEVEVEVDEEEEDDDGDEDDGLEEVEERRNGSSPTSASASNSASTAVSTTTSSSQSTSLGSLPAATSTSTPAAVASDGKTTSNISTLLSRLLVPEQPKEHQMQHLASIPITKNHQNKHKHPQVPKFGTPMPLARTIIANLHGLDSNHVLPKLPVQGECGVCLYDFHVAGGSDARFAVMFHPTIHDHDTGHEADTPREREKKRKRETVQSKVQIQALTKEDLWPGYDFTRLIWCKGSCGTSYHKECMGEWIHMMRTAKKPYKPS